MRLTRRRLLARAATAAAGAVAPIVLNWPAQAAEFTYKCGTALPDGHPMVSRGREAAAKIKEESGGRLDITFYTNSVLGQDTAMISQTIAGALEMYCLPIDLLAPKNPACGIFSVGFAFDELLAGKLGDRFAVGCRIQERIVFLGGDASERLEPVRVVRGAMLNGPVLHRFRNGIGH